MDGNVLLLLPILLPIVMGSLVLTAKGFRKNRKLLIAAVSGTLAVGVILTWAALMTGGEAYAVADDGGYNGRPGSGWG